MMGRRRVDLDLRARLAAWLKYFMDQAPNLSQRKFAERLGVSQGSISDNLTGKKTVSTETLFLMFTKLGADPSLMFRYWPADCATVQETKKPRRPASASG
jgi:transcriptional regulator with XRE-family HTH domain